MSKNRTQHILVCFVLSIALVSQLSTVQAQDNETTQDKFTTSIQPFIESYCLDCHSEGGEGDVDLSRFCSTESVSNDLESWAHVLDNLRQGDMPPDDADQPSRAESKAVQEWILATIDANSDQLEPLGRIRRLNRAEYENTIRDLFYMNRDCFNNTSRVIQTTDYFDPASKKLPDHVFAVTYQMNSQRRYSDLPGVSTLPVDPPVEHGFPNDQEALSLPPILMESYFEIANSILESPDFDRISGSWKRLFSERPQDNAKQSVERAKRNLTRFLPRAFRRDVEPREIERYHNLFQTEFKDSGFYSAAMKSTIAAVLVSPKFLFHDEFESQVDSAATNNESRDQQYARAFALASRLSYFLWASMPDDELLEMARSRKLLEQTTFNRQVSRMMRDPRIKSLSIDFGMQWLKLQKAASSLPDPDKYPDYYVKSQPPPAVSMMVEQMLFFEAIMVEDRSILDFIKSDFAYLNKQLINWYQLDMEDVLGFEPANENYEDFFRITWPSAHRGGVISSGAMLVSTSTTTRTSPVYRGAWILDVVFNAPPPPAPADVPPLEPADENLHTELNVREKLAQHRLDPACSSCHNRIDPLGFGLEIFDTVGRWRRTYDNGDPIDASGELDGEAYEGPVRLKNVILRQKERFVQAFVEHTLKYALGRKLHYSDEPEIKRITNKVIAQDCRFHSVIHEIVSSKVFRR